jgi:hypothetical protein
MLSIKRVLSFSLFTLFIGYTPLSLSSCVEEESRRLPTSPWKPLLQTKRELSNDHFPSLACLNSPHSSVQTHNVFLPPEFKILSWKAQPMMKRKGVIDTDQMTASDNRVEVTITIPRNIYDVMTRLIEKEKTRTPEDAPLVYNSYGIGYTADHLRMGFRALFETHALEGKSLPDYFSGICFRRETFWETMKHTFRSSSRLLPNLTQRQLNKKEV